MDSVSPSKPASVCASMRERAADADGASGVDAALEREPDVVLMDISMPQTSGIEATHALHDQAPHIGVVVLTMLEDNDAVGQALRAGARGYLVKGAPQAEIVETIRGVHARRAVIGAVTAKQLGSVFAVGKPDDPFANLTPRERRVLEALAAGADDRERLTRARSVHAGRVGGRVLLSLERGRGVRLCAYRKLVSPGPFRANLEEVR
jgi:DNA-binding NarL/FixJ family response regulator